MGLHRYVDRAMCGKQMLILLSVPIYLTPVTYWPVNLSPIRLLWLEVVAVMYPHMSCLMSKPTKWLCAQRRLRSAWASAQPDQSSLCALWVAKDQRFLHADSENSDQTGRMPRLIWVFAGCTAILLVLSWGGSYVSRHSHVPLYPTPVGYWPVNDPTVRTPLPHPSTLLTCKWSYCLYPSTPPQYPIDL